MSAWPLALTYAGLTAGSAITLSNTTPVLAPAARRVVSITCNNLLAKAVTGVLQIGQDGIAPGPVGIVSYTVVCAAHQ